MLNHIRIIAPAIIILFAMPVHSNHVNHSGWDVDKVMESLPDPTPCDLATANEADPMRTVRDGVEYSDINAEYAISVCGSEANRVMEKYQNSRPQTKADTRDLRMIYQLSRAVSRGGDDTKAFEINEEARKRGYPYATYYAYLAHENGWGVARNPIRAKAILQESIDLRLPIAFHRRAVIELDRKKPDFDQVVSDLKRAVNGSRDVTLAWATYNEVRGEHMLRVNASCIAGHCGKKIRDMTKYEMLFTFNYHGLRDYYGALESALNFYHDYMRNHPDSDATQNNIKRLEDRLELINPLIKSKLDDLYR
jgi:TPR repeat protein